MYFGSLYNFLKYLNKNQSWKKIKTWTEVGRFRPTASQHWLGAKAKMAWPARDLSARRARATWSPWLQVAATQRHSLDGGGASAVFSGDSEVLKHRGKERGEGTVINQWKSMRWRTSPWSRGGSDNGSKSGGHRGSPAVGGGHTVGGNQVEACMSFGERKGHEGKGDDNGA
jgi:hypothetical protein